MKPVNKISIAIALYTLVAIAGVGMAHGQVTVNYQTFPNLAMTPPITVLDSNVVTGCDSATANSYPGYQFEFWDNQGTISFSSTATICAGSGDGVANAWYLPTGGGGSCPPTCYVSTVAYSNAHHEFLISGTPPVFGTPITLVAPNSPVVWTAGSTTVNTIYSPESISAKSKLAFPPYKAEPFRFWQEIGNSTPTPVGIVYQASLKDTYLVIAFYGPDPCNGIRGEVQSCVEEGGLNCSGLIKALQACEVQNREPH